MNRSGFTKSHTEYLMLELHKKCSIRAVAPAEDSEVSAFYFIFMGIWVSATWEKFKL